MAICQIAPFIYNTLAFASSTAVVFITYDRWFAITCPMRHRCRITWHHVSCMVALSWGVLAVFVLLAIVLTHYGYLGKEYSQSMARCGFTSIKIGEILVLVFYTVFFVLPFCVTLYFYSCIMWFMVKHYRNPLHTGLSGHSRRNNVRTFAFISLLIVLFFTSWFPNYVVSVLSYIGVSIPLSVKLFCFVLFYTNLFTDPLVYACNCPLIRSSFNMSSVVRSKRSSSDNRETRASTGVIRNRASVIRNRASVYPPPPIIDLPDLPIEIT